jgi:hypothetical protein
VDAARIGAVGCAGPAYAVNIAPGTVTQIRTATGTALEPITLKAGLAAIVITP